MPKRRKSMLQESNRRILEARRGKIELEKRHSEERRKIHTKKQQLEKNHEAVKHKNIITLKNMKDKMVAEQVQLVKNNAPIGKLADLIKKQEIALQEAHDLMRIRHERSVQELKHHHEAITAMNRRQKVEALRSDDHINELMLKHGLLIHSMEGRSNLEKLKNKKTK